ncbi:MAG: hypothetical protein II793_06500, partial [Bacteroidales bacterium]|nr:hypothetical protein [Bacteroidales bacterium]
MNPSRQSFTEEKFQMGKPLRIIRTITMLISNGKSHFDAVDVDGVETASMNEKLEENLRDGHFAWFYVRAHEKGEKDNYIVFNMNEDEAYRYGREYEMHAALFVDEIHCKYWEKGFAKSEPSGTFKENKHFLRFLKNQRKERFEQKHEQTFGLPMDMNNVGDVFRKISELLPVEIPFFDNSEANRQRLRDMYLYVADVVRKRVATDNEIQCKTNACISAAGGFNRYASRGMLYGNNFPGLLNDDVERYEMILHAKKSGIWPAGTRNEMITAFSAGGHGACAYGINVTMEDLSYCWKHEEYKRVCPKCGETEYVVAWAGNVASGGYWMIRAYCPNCREVHQYSQVGHTFHWTKLRSVIEKRKKSKYYLDFETVLKEGFRDGRIVLMDRSSLECYPRVGESQSEADGKNDASTHENHDRAQQDRTAYLFQKNAFFLLDNYKRILSDSRMFLCPIPIQNNVMQAQGTPSLGAYIQWWMNCEGAMRIDKNGRRRLVYHLAGSALSGCNHCEMVLENGKTKTIQLESPFSRYCHSLDSLARAYADAMQKYQSYTLQEVLLILRYEMEGDKSYRNILSGCYTGSSVEELKEQIGDLESLLDENEASYNSLEQRHFETLMQWKESEVGAFYSTYIEKKNNIDKMVLNLRAGRTQRREALKQGQMDNKEYQAWYGAAKKEIDDARLELGRYAKSELLRLFPQEQVEIGKVEKYFSKKGDNKEGK